MTVVDAHAHVFARRSERFPRDVQEDYFPAGAEATAEELLAGMAAAGVARAVLVPVTHHDEYVAHRVRTMPGYGETLAAVDALLGDLDDTARARVRGGNALELFW